MNQTCIEKGCNLCDVIGMENEEETVEDVNIPNSEFIDLAKRRFSVRKYLDRPVRQEIINSVIDAGRVAPTAKNIQPYVVLLIKSPESMEKLGKGAKTFGAPVAFVICSDTSAAFIRPFDGKSMSDIDVSIVTDHMMLAATDFGLGTLWMTYFNPEIIRKEFNIPEKYEPVNILLMGYSAEIDSSPDRHVSTRKRTDELVVRESF